ncbi:copper transport protein CTR2 [Ceratobasidium sp. AG-Ba]|nr:copper transport protein CTR2 [Ceratobasidium sp. AG-Ba]
MHPSITFIVLCFAGVSNAMDMPMSSPSNGPSMGSMMIPYLHFTGGDYLYFAGVSPTSKGAIAGACIVFVILAVLERAVAGARGIFEFKLNERRRLSLAKKQDSPSIDRPLLSKDESVITSAHESIVRSNSDSTLRPLPSGRQRIMAPLVWPHELARGALFVVQSFFLYTLMLGVIIIAGSAIGEVLFGRFITELTH